METLGAFLFIYILFPVCFAPILMELPDMIEDTGFEGPANRAAFGVVLVWPLVVAGALVYGVFWILRFLFRNFFPALGDVVKLAITVGNK